MSKKKLFEDIKQNPARIYRMPAMCCVTAALAMRKGWKSCAPGATCCSDPTDAADDRCDDRGSRRTASAPAITPQNEQGD